MHSMSIYIKCKNRQNYSLLFKGAYVAGGTMKKSKEVITIKVRIVVIFEG